MARTVTRVARGVGALLAACSLTAPVLAHDEELAEALSRASDVFYHVPQGAEGEVYSDQYFAGPFSQAVGLAFDSLNRLWVWEKKGKVRLVTATGAIASEPMIDISEEVADFGAHGMLGFAFDPDFTQTGYIYLFYAVDYHHLAHYGEPTYDPEVSEDFHDTIARIARYQVEPVLPGMQVKADPASRVVLVGEDETSGFPVCATSHGVGSLAFGEDGSLLASFGDSHLPNTGSGHCQSEGILTAAEDVGNYRAQLRDSLAGKIVRIDPATGDGMPDNPFFDPLEPRAARSRVWATGLRQPYRMTVRPGSGSVMDPGSIYVADVGAQTWEEVDVVRFAASNLGWPLYEGMEKNLFYFNQPHANLDAPNPLFGQNVPGVGVCGQEFFDFQDLLHQDVVGALDLPNPCDPAQQVPLDLQSEHLRPSLCWKHDEPIALTKTFVGGEASSAQLGEPGAPVAGDSFPGNAAIGGVWYTGFDFPEKYWNTYFVGDYGEGWIKALRFDTQDRLEEVLSFSDDGVSPVAFATHPSSDGLFYINYVDAGGSSLRKIEFVGDLPPIAVAGQDVLSGTSPLLVQFDATSSSDPEGGPLTYEWDFGDGSPISTEPAPSHAFGGPGPVAYEVVLTVTDDAGMQDEQVLSVSVDNTPPQAEILGPANGAAYSASQIELLSLTSSVSDAESPSGELSCRWDVVLYHDNHIHPEPESLSCAAATGVAPHTEDGDVEYYEVRLTVTDPHALSSTVSHWLVREDDCNLNGYPDASDIALGWSLDTDLDGVPDECAADCDGDGMSDPLAVGVGVAPDCNGNGIPDACDIAGGASLDLDGNSVPDECQELFADIATISASAGGVQTLSLELGAEHAGDFYWVFGSLTGTSPGTPFGPVTLPLTTPDPYFDLTLGAPAHPPFVGLFGFAGGAGEASAQIVFQPNSPPAYAGITLHHAAVVVDAGQLALEGIELATNPVTLELVP